MLKRNSPGCTILRAALESGDWSRISKAGFKQSDFSEDARIVYNWVDKYVTQYAQTPSVELVEEGSGVVLPPSAAWDYAEEAFREFLLRQEIKDRINAIKVDLNSGNTRAAASRFQPIEIESRQFSTFTGTRQDVFDDYLDRKLKGIPGIEIPWPTLADNFVKWEDSTLNAMLAMSNVGKTWLSCYIAYRSMSAGHRVLFVSLENELNSIQRRLTSLHYKIPFTDIRNAQADLRIERRWQEAIQSETIPGEITIATRSQIRTVADISAVNLSDKPDFIIVDGAYLLRGKGQSNWESAAEVLNQLQYSAKLGKAPWLCTSQLNPAKNKTATGYDKGYEARYAKEWMLNPDTSFILLQSEDDRAYNKARIQICKIREAGDVTGYQKEFEINSNRTTMDFSEIQGEQEYGIEY